MLNDISRHKFLRYVSACSVGRKTSTQTAHYALWWWLVSAMVDNRFTKVEERTMFDLCTIKVVEMQIRCGVDCGGKVDASWCW